ncbi:Wzt carbohydrate-binding domain-containing protein [Nodosilinea sp. LEGE 07298]|uniref:Wzt carbohydrate-binding domain-containing protein n=1 Tax=Nodosilinea sp. LEGE 07298 TaxID=2777970 RepID=UPI00187FBCE2|nr:Wzt carbohydrate-binding domain-containing protein [Nodosilinea sp. LEGE 07298]MBE9111789.1 Wzt carbohydrate-binding domain-containing protein [Nodosilinea sp. LEGE 07298]
MADPTLPELYDPDFFTHLQQGSKRSATIIAPLVLEWTAPKSVVDIGCGDGTWLSVFQGQGVEDILGLDGSYVQPETLKIHQECFVSRDLNQPFVLDRRFDLAMSLEVAEHLPAASAPGFVASLVQLSDVVLFSAAIPHQGGTHHINEQWPDYWIALFEAEGYVVIDGLRPRIWDHPDVEPWYAQNSFLFVRGDRLHHYPKLQQLTTQPSFSQHALAHPKIYLQQCPDVAESSPDTGATQLSPDPSFLIKILNLTCAPSSEISSGEGITLELEYQLQAPVDAAIFSLSLSDSSGQIYLDTDTEINPLPTNWEKPQYLQLQIDRLDLAHGRYFFNPGVYASDWKQIYDFHWHRYPLTIGTTSPSKGILNPPLVWHSPTPASHEA